MTDSYDEEQEPLEIVTDKASIIKEHRVASLTTNSLREILKLFQVSNEGARTLITRLRAEGSSQQQSSPFFQDEDYGVTTYNKRTFDSFKMDYEVKYDRSGSPLNPIDSNAIKRIESAMKDVGIEDAAVELVAVQLTDPQLGVLTGTGESQYHMYLQSDPVDGDADRQKVKEHPVNEILMKNYGFKYRILHCRRLIDLRSELTLPKSDLVSHYIINWTGETVYSLNSPVRIAQYLKDSYFGDYKLIKVYGAGVEDTLVLLGAER